MSFHRSSGPILLSGGLLHIQNIQKPIVWANLVLGTILLIGALIAHSYHFKACITFPIAISGALILIAITIILWKNTKTCQSSICDLSDSPSHPHAHRIPIRERTASISPPTAAASAVSALPPALAYSSSSSSSSTLLVSN